MARYENYRENRSHSRHHGHHGHRHSHHHGHHRSRDYHRNHHSHTRHHYPTYNPVEYSYDDSHGVEDSVKCEFPRFTSQERLGRIPWAINVLSWIFLTPAIISQIMILVFTIKFVNTDNTGFELESPNFPLFKNSRFEECWNLTPDPANCTAIVDILRNSPYELDKKYLDRGYTPISSQWRSHDGIEYGWCAFASCFHGFKVVPSVARPSIVGETKFDLWNTLNMSALVSLLTFVKRSWDVGRGKQNYCTGSLKEVGIINWGGLIYTIVGPFVFWWVSFIRFAIDPVSNSAVSIFAWRSIWLLASTVHYHPWSCVLRGRPGLKQFLSWFLAILALVQWCATLYVLSAGWGALQKEGITQGYDCVEAMIRDAPGTTQCSAEKLCSDTILLSNVSFYWDSLEQNIVYIGLSGFTILSATALQPFVWATWRSFTRPDESWGEHFKRGDIGLVFGFIFAGLFVLLMCALTATVVVNLSAITDREAPVVANTACNAVHVGLSNWRYYLDVSIYSRALRIAKAWFNA
ncbi:hypothetical protein F5Y13DRAFT_17748 [Hypoxylon sp. FL1857]|nr:hypothetical protein F5Y13DRAFT_17748 [Hypoxylon sp. FL1857]